MQIHGRHSNFVSHSRFGGPHTQTAGGVQNASGTVRSQGKILPLTQSELAGVDLAALKAKLRELPQVDEAVVQQAVARFESGQLIAREAAESTAATQLQEFVF